MTDHDKLDRLLDKALSEYSNVSPREGLEQRLLARLAEQKRPERNWNWRWLWAAVPAIAAILVIIFFSARPITKHGNNVANVPTTTPVMPERKAVPANPSLKIATAHHKARAHRVSTLAPKESPAAQPRLSTFPSPDDSEQQARLLLRFVTHTPGEAAQVATEQEEFQKLAEARMNQDLEDRSER